MREDILARLPGDRPRRACEVIYNGIDTDEYAPDPAPTCSSATGSTRTRRRSSFVGRITRQKGVPHLLRAARELDPERAARARAPARPTRRRSPRRSTRAVERLRPSASGVFWIEEMLPKPEVIQLLSHATVFACPSIYEPLGIVNLEAMACEAAVVATATGGIVEVVVDGETGLLVPFEPGDDGTRRAARPGAFAARLRGARERAGRATRRAPSAMGRAGRARAVERFAWPAIAEQTAALYRRLASSSARRGQPRH